jgi:Glycosyltransferase 61
MSQHLVSDPVGFQKSFERVSNGFVTPTLVGDGKISGCVYRADRSKVALSERFGGWKGDLFQSNNPEVLERPPCLERPGRGLYLGALMAAHYGHFITEGLSTFWIFETLRAGEFDYFLFSPFVFGCKIPEYAKQCMRVFGIDSEKIVIIGDEAIGFEELVVPERLFRLNHSADPALAWVHRQIRIQAKKPELPAERVYLSRRKVSLKQLSRVIANEVLVEKIFQQAGFQILYPETVSFEEQLAFYANADVVAGPSGSALHNSLFMKPGAKLIELGDPRYGGERAPTQVLCDTVADVRACLVPFVGTIRGEGASVTVDVEDLRSRLIRVLTEIGISTSGIGNSVIRATPTEWLECIYLAYRPMVGPILRSLGIRR